MVDVPREVYFFKVRASNPNPNPDPDPDPNPNFYPNLYPNLYPNPSFFEVVVVPLTGDPDIYISFDTRTPTGANYTFMQDMVGVDVFRLARNNYPTLTLALALALALALTLTQP